MKRSVLVLLAVLGAVSSAAETKHYSFSNGYPATATRQPSRTTGASFGAGGASAVSRAGTAKRGVEERTLVGAVTRVDAGDVLWVTPPGGRRTKVRLRDADAPEQGQNYGVEAKKFLFDLVNGKDATVRYFTRDKSGAIEGTVFIQHEKGLVDVNLTLVRNGCAWYVESARPADVRDDTSRTRAYSAAEADARKSKRGLWSELNPIRPSEWRKLHR